MDHSPTGERTADDRRHGLEIESIADGIATATIPFDGKPTNPYGVINGAVIAALVDAASGALSRASVKRPAEPALATSQWT